MKTYDTFSPNPLERFGKIERKSFSFTANNCEIWHQGNCIIDMQSVFEIQAKVNPVDGKIDVTIDNSRISEYIVDFFTFSGITLANDRVLWGNNFFNPGAELGYKDPSFMSLFYYSGILSKVTFTIPRGLSPNPNMILIEFTSSPEEQITHIENPFNKQAREVAKKLGII